MRGPLPIYFFLFGLFAGFSCRNENKNAEQGQAKTFTKSDIDKQFIKANQLLVQKENDEMDYYEKSHKLNFVRTGSGIRYLVYKPSVKGDSIKEGMEISMNYVVKLLDGTLCYSSKQEGKKTFIVEHERIESGIHKGVQYLKRGDKAILLIPSPLAHGLLGDMNKIPPMTPIVYEIAID